MNKYLLFQFLFSISLITYAQNKVIDSTQRSDRGKGSDSLSLEVSKKEVTKNISQLDSISKEKKSTIFKQLKDSISENKSSKDSIREQSQDSLFTKKQKDTVLLTSKEKRKSLREKLRRTKKEKPVFTYKKYQIISYERDTTYLDTSLNINKTYKFNYLRRDMFGKMPLDNVGQAHTRLARNFDDIDLFPKMGLAAKHYNYEEKRQTKYFSMASPTTELYYKNGVNQGQMAGVWLSLNTSKQFNITWSYDGLRSLGYYKNFLANSTKMKFSMNYHTKNERLQSRFHFTDQRFENKENGGIKNEEEFEKEGKDEFKNREKINVNYTDVNTELFGRRYYFDNELFLSQRYGLKGTKISLGHQFMYHIKYFIFSQESPVELYGTTINPSGKSDVSDYRALENKIFSNISNKWLGDISLEATNQKFKYFFQRLYYKEDELIPNIIQGNDWTMEVLWKRNLIKNTKAEFAMGRTMGNSPPVRAYTKWKITYKPKNDFFAEVSAAQMSRYPSLNTLLHQSNYTSYNWINQSSFRIGTAERYFIRLRYKKLLDIKAEYNTLNNYTYFAQLKSKEESEKVPEEDPKDPLVQKVNVVPIQYKMPIEYLKVKFSNEFRFWKLALRNDVLYQNVSQTSQVLNVPKIITRNTLYLFSDVFNKAMYLEVGMTLNYFTEYYADQYNPLIGEYNIQTRKLIGGYSMLDAFISARVKQTRLFMSLEHFNSANFDYYYAAPRYPYRDLTFRFGIVWDFFM